MTRMNTTDLRPSFFRPVAIPAAEKPRLFVVVDTEEEFDWEAPFSRESTSVTAIDEVDRLQDLLARHRLLPTYVVDYPVASTKASAERLGAYARRGECQIGAHLHPWVSPPYTETLGQHASFACNLGAELELDKIRRLKQAIESALGVKPRSYKAGRYGFGPTTAEILESLDFDIDLSVNPHMDNRPIGPSFEGFAATPGWFGSRRRLLELPCTTGFVGLARRVGPALHRAASAVWLRPVRAIGLLSRSGTLNKVMLSPEGNTLGEMRALTRALLRDGVRTFALTFHSPSLKPGCTRYVRTAADRAGFLSTIDQYCEEFMGRFGGVPATPADLFDEFSQDGMP